MKSLKSAKAFKDVLERMSKSVEGVNKKSFKSIVEISIYKETIDRLRQRMEKLSFTTIGTEAVSHNEEEICEEPEVAEVEVEEEKPQSQVKTKSIASEQNWLKYKPIRWKLDKGIYPSYYKTGMMVSEEGDVWDLVTDTLLETGFYDGEMKAVIPADRFCNQEHTAKTMRIAPMVARIFGIAHEDNDGTSNYIIDYIDGDRRNLRPSNLRWIKRKLGTQTTTRELAKIIADDICRRLVDTNGDVEKTLAMYPPTSTNITSKYISDIRFKLIETGLSNKYFDVDSKGNFIPKGAEKKTEETPKEKKPVIDMSMMSDERLDEKIRTGKLSIADKNLLLYRTIQSLKDEGIKKITAEIVVDAVRDKYKGVSLPTDMAKMMLEGGLV